MPYDVHASCAAVSIVDARAALVNVTPPRGRVAIVGFATNTLHLVPWYDTRFELWGLNQGAANFKRRADRWFEMHTDEFVDDFRQPEYRKFLAEGVACPVYMIDIREDVPTSMRYPIERAIELTGRDYFTSSVAFMIAAAVLEGFREIHVYGVNLAIGDEYTYEKPCAEYWIGQAEGRGVRVHVPTASALLKQYARYGYSPHRDPNTLTKQLLANRIAAYQAECEGKLRDYHVQLGALREAQMLVQAIEGAEHGADIVIPAPTT